jgi:hypothetical protein
MFLKATCVNSLHQSLRVVVFVGFAFAALPLNPDTTTWASGVFLNGNFKVWSNVNTTHVDFLLQVLADG